MPWERNPWRPFARILPDDLADSRVGKWEYRLAGFRTTRGQYRDVVFGNSRMPSRRNLDNSGYTFRFQLRDPTTGDIYYRELRGPVEDLDLVSGLLAITFINSP